MAKIALTYRNEQNIICTEVVDTEAPRYKELTESVFMSDHVFLSSKKVDDETEVGIISRKKTLRYSDRNRNNYREQEIEYQMEKLGDGTEVPRFVNFKPFTIMGLKIENAPTQDGDLLMINYGPDGQIIPKDVKEVRALRYTLKLLQVFNNTLLNDDGDDEDNLPVSENNKDKSKGETISSDSEDSQKENDNSTDQVKDRY